MSDFYRRIGQQAVKLAPGPFLKLLVYSEAQDGVISADVFFQVGHDPVVRHRRAPPELTDLIHEFWENGDCKVQPRSWAAMHFWIESGAFRTWLIYPGDLRPGEYLDRRPRVVADYFPLTEVDYSKPSSTTPPVPVRSEAFEELVKAAGRYLTDCQRDLEQEYRLSKWSRYDWSQETGQLVFSDRGARKVIADIQFVGSVSTETDTWLWAWDNDSVDPGLFEALLRIRQYGEVHGFPHLTIPKWYAHEVDGWEMTSIAAFLLRAKGAYRSPRANGVTFMLITSVGWAI